MEVMSEFYGEDAFVPYGPKTISNMRSEFRNENRELDIGETLEYFKELQQKYPKFYFKFSFDAENIVENIFWVDSVARKDYVEAYHDCVSFNTTFYTNRFNMLFAPFIGINMHGQYLCLVVVSLEMRRKKVLSGYSGSSLKRCMACSHTTLSP